MRGPSVQNSRLLGQFPPNIMVMDDLTTERILYSQATWVIDMNDLFFDM